MKIHEIDNGKYFVRLVAKKYPNTQHTSTSAEFKSANPQHTKLKLKLKLNYQALSYRKSANQIRKSQHTTHIHIRRVQIRKSQHTTHIHIRDDCEQS